MTTVELTEIRQRPDNVAPSVGQTNEGQLNKAYQNEDVSNNR